VALILYSLLIPKFGFLGTAYVSMVQLILLKIIYLIFVYKMLKLNPFNKNILVALFFIISSIIFFKNFMLHTPLIIKGFLTTVVYFAIIVGTGVLKKESLVLWYNLLKRKPQKR